MRRIDFVPLVDLVGNPDVDHEIPLFEVDDPPREIMNVETDWRQELRALKQKKGRSPYRDCSPFSNWLRRQDSNLRQVG